MMRNHFFKLSMFAVTLSLLVTATGCSWFEDGGEEKDEFYRPYNKGGKGGPGSGKSDFDPNRPSSFKDGTGMDNTYDGFGVPIPDVKFQPVFFKFDQSNLLTTEYGKLDEIVKFLQSRKDAGVVIEGNCDARGSEEYNRALGERRAISAQEYLQASGIESSRIKTISYGKDRPAAAGDTEEAYRQNRRDDFVAVKLLK